MEQNQAWYKTALQNVRGDSLATITIVTILAGCSLLVAGVDPWKACGFPGTIYVLYGFRTLIDNGHKRKMARIEVEKIEAEYGKTVRMKTQKALERRRKRDGKPS
ncbi:conserved hypothetical protein [Mesorhizobium plurifarium]|uniref:Uncharacterized protein n=1 Tax=Mesorhizobium plurifarium TaxID=69974 RepID=A0A090DPM9_MESPL|nr:conserved hypothetical protein [Mesorhizobium plurifarium]